MQSHWWAWEPKVVLKDGQLMPQEVCTDGTYIDQFIVSRGTAVINANSTQAFRATGILSVQGRCSNGKQLGYYGPSASDTSVSYKEENIAVSLAPPTCLLSCQNLPAQALAYCSCLPTLPRDTAECSPHPAALLLNDVMQVRAVCGAQTPAVPIAGGFAKGLLLHKRDRDRVPGGADGCGGDCNKGN